MAPGRIKVAQLRDFIHELYVKETEIIKENLKHYARTTLMLWGKPGAGKTTGVNEAGERIAKTLGRKFVVYDDSVAEEILKNPDTYFVLHSLPEIEHEPVDFTGALRIDQELGCAKFWPFLWMKVLQRCPGILFLDDHTNHPRDDIRSVAMKITNERRTGYQTLHDGVAIIAASNNPEYSVMARGLSWPEINRCANEREVLEPTPDEWAAWMDEKYGERWDKRHYIFYKRFESENYLLKLPSEPEVTDNFPTPRSCTRCAVLSHYGMFSPEMFLGAEIGQKLRAFLAISVDIEELVADPAKWDGLNIDSKYMAISMLASWLGQQKKDEYKRASELIDTMVETSKEYFALLCRSTKRSVLTNLLLRLNPKYVKLAQKTIKDIGELTK